MPALLRGSAREAFWRARPLARERRRGGRRSWGERRGRSERCFWRLRLQLLRGRPGLRGRDVAEGPGEPCLEPAGRRCGAGWRRGRDLGPGGRLALPRCGLRGGCGAAPRCGSVSRVLWDRGPSVAWSKPRALALWQAGLAAAPGTLRPRSCGAACQSVHEIMVIFL